MKAETDLDVFLSELYQLYHELSDLGKVVSIGRLTTIIILDALPAKKKSTIKIQMIKDPDLCLGEIGSMMAVFINHTDRPSVSNKNESRVVP